MYPFASLPENLAAFCDVLRRSHRFRIGPGELHDATRALELVDLASESVVRDTLRPILSACRDDATAFDPAFRRFFIPEVGAQWPDDSAARGVEPGAALGGSGERALESRASSLDDVDVDQRAGAPASAAMPSIVEDEQPDAAAIVARSSYSPLEAAAVEPLALRPVDDEWRDAARALVQRAQLGLSRRWRPAGKGRRYDLRRTLRASLHTGGEALTVRWLRRQRRAPRFALLVDGSRSMRGYTGSALQLAVALARATTRLEIFIFSTSLRRITGEVRKAAAGDARSLPELGYAWGGGTSIGACLGEFVRRFGERLVTRDTIVIVASDGLDLGEPAALGETMATLRRRAAAIVWLNPLLDTAGYEPTAAGMSAARMSITTFTNVRQAADLARLARSIRLH